MFVVNEMVPPTNSRTRVVDNSHIIIKLCREFREISMPSAQVVHDRGHDKSIRFGHSAEFCTRSPQDLIAYEYVLALQDRKSVV